MNYYSCSFVLILATGLLLTLPSRAQNPATDIQPNILLIQTDEHNFRTLGCYRELLPPDQALVWGEGNVVETPHIDFLAQNGILFNKFYAVTPVCSPSRASLVSGMYPQHNGVSVNDVPMHDNVITFAQVLKQAGYRTGFIGKWHLDGEGKPQWAPQRKFGFTDNHYMFNRGHWKKMELTTEGPRIAAQNKKGEPTYSLDHADKHSFTTDFLTDRCIDFMRKNTDAPFFLYLSFPDPHGPDAVRAPYDTLYKHMQFATPSSFTTDSTHAPKWALPEKNTKLTHDQYFGMIKCIDDNIGRILDYLRHLQLLNHTIVIFTSDHGDLRAEHGRHNKGNPFEASAKVPFIIFYPDQIPGGAVINNAFNTVDFAPSLLNFLGLTPPESMEGRDFSMLLRHPEEQSRFEDITLLRSTGTGSNGGWLAAVTSRYKLIISSKDEPWLFDLEQDPHEIQNLIHQANYKNITQTLARAIEQYAVKHEDPFLNNTAIAVELQKLLR